MRNLYQTSIPVFAAGGVYTREDIAALLNIGASGVRWQPVLSQRRNAMRIWHSSRNRNAGKRILRWWRSPAGLPGRAVMTAFMRNASKGRIAPKHCIGCMKPCVPASTPYCISDALVHSVEGDVENGLVFAGANAWRVTDIVSVHDRHGGAVCIMYQLT